MPSILKEKIVRRHLTVIALAGLPLVAPHTASAQSETPQLAVGAHAPGAAVKTLSGTPVDLSHYIGKTPVVIEFWAKWCPNCRALEPKMTEARNTYGARVSFVTIAASVDETPAQVRAYAKAHGLIPDVLYDETGAAVDAYGAPGTSYVVVIDRKGSIVYTGAGGDQDLIAAIKAAL
jgi:thiol-disulfide isomerase/thioredoxin